MILSAVELHPVLDFRESTGTILLVRGLRVDTRERNASPGTQPAATFSLMSSGWNLLVHFPYTNNAGVSPYEYCIPVKRVLVSFNGFSRH